MISLLVIVSQIFRLINGILLYFILRTFLPMRKPKIYQILAFVCCWGIADVKIWIDDAVSIIGTLVAFLAVSLLLFKGKWIEKISMVLILYPMIMAVNFITYYIGESIVFAFYGYISVETVFSMVVFDLTIAARIPVWYFTWKFCKKYVEDIVKLLDIKMWMLINCICITMFTAVLIVLNLSS